MTARHWVQSVQQAHQALGRPDVPQHVHVAGGQGGAALGDFQLLQYDFRRARSSRALQQEGTGARCQSGANQPSYSVTVHGASCPQQGCWTAEACRAGGPAQACAAVNKCSHLAQLDDVRCSQVCRGHRPRLVKQPARVKG
jgi:hypothetical protein